jgi:hypothetical protein
MHLIPAAPEVWTRLKRARPGQVVRLRGYLVSVTAPDGWRWDISLSRTDTGAGGCEPFRVEGVSLTG